MNRKLINSELDKYRKRGKGTYTYCDVGCDCNIAVNLLEENQELKAKIKTYENPEDLTLMFMYCEEKTKDKIKELKKQLEETQANYEKEKYIVDKQTRQLADEYKNTEYQTNKVKKLENQQKEFISWLENMLSDDNDIFSVVRVKDVLQKYKEILGDK